jgi:hypothetical protein
MSPACISIIETAEVVKQDSETARVQEILLDGHRASQVRDYATTLYKTSEMVAKASKFHEMDRKVYIEAGKKAGASRRGPD